MVHLIHQTLFVTVARIICLYMQLDNNVGSLFRSGYFTITPVVHVPITLNCDVPYLAVYTGDQKLTCTREPHPYMEVPKDHILLQKLSFGLFDGYFPTKLHLRLCDKDNIPNFLEKIHSGSRTFIELHENFDTDLPPQESVTYVRRICVFMIYSAFCSFCVTLTNVRL